ncbi:hypothetical protein D3C75_720810 [compost metagenome]
MKSVPFMLSPGSSPSRRYRIAMPEPSRSNTSAADNAWWQAPSRTTRFIAWALTKPSTVAACVAVSLSSRRCAAVASATTSSLPTRVLQRFCHSAISLHPVLNVPIQPGV